MNRHTFALLIAGLLVFTAGILAGLEIALVVRGVFAVLCFGIGVAFAVGTVQSVMYPEPYNFGAIWGMIAGMFLLGAFLLLRRKPPT